MRNLPVEVRCTGRAFLDCSVIVEVARNADRLAPLIKASHNGSRQARLVIRISAGLPTDSQHQHFHHAIHTAENRAKHHHRTNRDCLFAPDIKIHLLTTVKNRPLIELDPPITLPRGVGIFRPLVPALASASPSN